jgi:hypothetical protein
MDELKQAGLKPSFHYPAFPASQQRLWRASVLLSPQVPEKGDTKHTHTHRDTHHHAHALPCVPRAPGLEVCHARNMRAAPLQLLVRRRLAAALVLVLALALAVASAGPTLVARDGARPRARQVVPSAGGGERPACEVVRRRVPDVVDLLAGCSPDCRNASCQCCSWNLPGRYQGLLCNVASCCLRVIVGSRDSEGGRRPLIASFEPLEATGLDSDAMCTAVRPSNSCRKTCAFVVGSTGVQDCGASLAMPPYDSDMMPTGKCSNVNGTTKDPPAGESPSPSVGKSGASNKGKVIGFVIGMIALLAIAFAILLAVILTIAKRKTSSSSPGARGDKRGGSQSASFQTFDSVAGVAGGSRAPPAQRAAVAGSSTSGMAAPVARAVPGVAGAVATLGTSNSSRQSAPRAAETPVSYVHIPASAASDTQGQAMDMSVRNAPAPAPFPSAAGQNAAHPAVQDDDMDGISLVELGETVGGTSDGAEAEVRSHNIPIEDVRPSSSVRLGPPEHEARFSPDPYSQSDDFRESGAKGSHAFHDYGKHAQLLDSTNSVVSIERTGATEE